MIHVKGQNGQVQFDGQYVTIIRKGFGAVVMGQTRGEKRILVSTLTAIQFKPAGMTLGYIQFTLPGGVESRSRRTMDAAGDENTVTFTTKQQPAFMELRAAVEQAMAGARQPGQVSAPSVADELAKFADLHRQGLLTDAEFAAQKARLLG